MMHLSPATFAHRIRALPAPLRRLITTVRPTKLARALPLGWGIALKVAVTALASSIVSVQGPVPVQPEPLKPANVDPGAGVADTVTWLPGVNPALHSDPQLMP